MWDRFHPVTIQEFLVSEEKRKEYWRQKRELYEALGHARPNAGHEAITRLEKAGKLKGIITQNIDGLHALAGNSPEKILELHGTNRQTVCLSCAELTSWEETWERLKSGEEVPLCRRCGGFLKPDTISFGQNLNPQTLQTALEWSTDCDLMLALGSTLVVEPAASLPRVAKQHGARLVIVTRSTTPLDALANIKLETGIGELLAQVVP